MGLLPVILRCRLDSSLYLISFIRYSCQRDILCGLSSVLHGRRLALSELLVDLPLQVVEPGEDLCFLLLREAAAKEIIIITCL